ncbi:MAG: AAA family ATPase [Mesorhizobium sp.]
MNYITGNNSSDKPKFGDVAEQMLRSATRLTLPTVPIAERQIEPNDSIGFLKFIDPVGWHNLVAISPEGAVEGRTFEPGSWSQMADWIRARNGTKNLYYSPNEPGPGAPHNKLSKTDIDRIRFLHVDLDPDKSKPFEDERRSLLKTVELLKADSIAPSAIVDSGGGVQALWKVDGDIGRADAEAQGRGLAHWLSGDATQNVDRVLRLPGTVNIPTTTKAAAGRIRTPATLLHSSDVVYTLATISAQVAPRSSSESAQDRDPLIAAAMDAIEHEAAACISCLDDLDPALRMQFNEACEAYPPLAALWSGDPRGLVGGDDSNSGWLASLAKRLAAVDGFDANDFAHIAHAWPHLAGDAKNLSPRSLGRAWGNMAAPDVERRRALLKKWFEPYVEPPEEPEPLFPITKDGPQTTRTPLPLLTLDDLESEPPVRWTLARHIPQTSVGFLYGEPGAKKSFLAIDMGLSIASREDYFGDPIDTDGAGVIVYIAGEGKSGLRQRVAAWKKQRGADENPSRFLIIPQAVDFLDSQSYATLQQTLARIGKPITGVIVDTVSRALPGVDENLQKEMSKFIRACDLIKARFECFVLCVHHSNAAGRMRGSSVLPGGADFIFRVEKRSPSHSYLFCEKMKDGSDGWGEHYRFEVVDVSDKETSLVPARLMSTAANGIDPATRERILEIIDEAWASGAPLAKAKNTGKRQASRVISSECGVPAHKVQAFLDMMELAGEVEIAVRDSSTKQRGYRLRVSEETDSSSDPDILDFAEVTAEVDFRK